MWETLTERARLNMQLCRRQNMKFIDDIMNGKQSKRLTSCQTKYYEGKNIQFVVRLTLCVSLLNNLLVTLACHVLL